MGQQIIVIGAGIIGISCALELQRRGASVTVLDRTGVAAEASQGNAGAFAFADIEPLATPGIMRKAPRWLLDPLGPLSVPPAYALKIAPWMLRFWRASWSDRYKAATRAQSALMDLSRAALTRQMQVSQGQDMILTDGQMQLYEGAAQFRAAARGIQLRRDHGIDLQELTSPGAIAEIQPGLSPQFTHGVLTPDWQRCTDPKLWTEHLARAFTVAGGQIAQAEIIQIAQTGARVRVSTTQGVQEADRLVVAAGAWSHHLTRQLGHKLPLETERGYNTTLPAGAFDLTMHLTFAGHGFVITKIGEGLRVGGAAELGGLTLPPNFRRSDILLQKAQRFLPGLKSEGGVQWMGFRPSMPDSLPVIGTAPGAPNVLYAFGHGHLGLTQSAGTAELIGDLAFGDRPVIDLHPYRPDRFL
ncbi:MAG: FAD-dependent oxidoreductase [Pelagimonas sp.]|jgi:D-amino-acid dehydrogenase|nr:FAD-dependent oxidoreductase [Pelagimonas sp.]